MERQSGEGTWMVGIAGVRRRQEGIERGRGKGVGEGEKGGREGTTLFFLLFFFGGEGRATLFSFFPLFYGGGGKATF
jgi:hypothetical protein